MFVAWFDNLFDATGFQPRGQCGPWSDSLIRIYLCSSGITTLAYLFISICLYLNWRKHRADVEYSSMLLLFATAIAASAAVHAGDIIVFWWPGYRLFTTLSAITAVLSLYAALWLPHFTRILLEIPSPSQFQQITSELKQAISQKEEAISESRGTIAALRRQVNHLERMRQTGLWVAEQETALRELKTVLDSSFAREAPK